MAQYESVEQYLSGYSNALKGFKLTLSVSLT
jgi:hypothetical protein